MLGLGCYWDLVRIGGCKIWAIDKGAKEYIFNKDLAALKVVLCCYRWREIGSLAQLAELSQKLF